MVKVDNLQVMFLLFLEADDFTNGNISFEDLSSIVTKAINDDKAVV